LQIQKHNRELELIVRECIMETIRASMPVEDILRAYLAETEEEETEVREEVIERPAPEPVVDAAPVEEAAVESESQEPDNSSDQDSSSNQKSPEIAVDTTQEVPHLSFSDVDKAMTSQGVEVNIEAPKTVERLEKIAQEAHAKRKAEEEDDDDMPLRIGEEVRLELADVSDLGRPVKLDDAPVLEIESLS